MAGQDERDGSEAGEALMRMYGIDSPAAIAILDMQLFRLTRDDQVSIAKMIEGMANG